MTWFKVDDSFYDHPKLEGVSMAARGLWITAGSYSANKLTDGYVTTLVLKRFTKRAANLSAELIEAGLWSATDDGICFHDWCDYQPTRNAVTSERLRTKERQKAWRERKRNGVTNASDNGVTNASQRRVTNTARGDGAPTRPDPYKNPPTPRAHPNDSPTRLTPGAKDDDPSFTSFWQAYPRKVGRPTALTAWNEAIATTEPHVILDGLTANLPTLSRAETQFQPHPATWLRNQRWTDQPPDKSDDPWAHLPTNPPAPKADNA